MCGIVGYICTDITGHYRNKKFFNQGLYVDALRGMHSTGVVGVWPDNNDLVVRDWKRAVPSPVFMNDPKMNIWEGPARMAMIGHNRHATQGDVTDDNAHPFTICLGDDEDTDAWIMGVHNGSVNMLGATAEHDVDSYNLYYSIAKLGLPAVGAIKGPYALVWYDLLQSRFYFARNKGRPLHCLFTPDGKSMYYASEAEMLYCLAKRNGIPILNDQVFAFDTDMIYSVSPELNQRINVEKQEVPEYEGKLVYSTPAKQEEVDFWEARYKEKQRLMVSRGPRPVIHYKPGDSGKHELDYDDICILKDKYDLEVGNIVMFYVTGWDQGWSTASTGILRLMTELWPEDATDREHTVILNGKMHRCHSICYQEWDKAGNLPFKVVDIWYDNEGDELHCTVEALSTNEFNKFVETHGDEFWYEDDWNILTAQELQPKIKEYKEALAAYVAGKQDIPGADEELDDEEPEPVRYRGPGGKFVSQERWHQLTNTGCGWCQADLFPTEAEAIVWQGDSPVCSTCASEHGEMIGILSKTGSIH